VAGEGAAVTPALLRRELGRLVPAYMLPARWRALDEFPRNANGKVDRRKLREMFAAETEAHAARTA
jgi:acyl-CoA synthetase (AMP-forming)/AMP-acid ligase II